LEYHLRRPQVILLDLDDTILDDSGGAEPAWRAVCAEAAEELDGVEPDVLFAAVDEVRTWFWDDPERHRTGRADLHAASRSIIEEALRRSGVDPQDGLADRLAGRYRALRDESITALPGALETLDHMRAAGFRLGLITNGAADVQRAKIDRFDLARHFDYIGIEGERGFGKPDPRAYRAALDALGCRPEDAWMAGDRLDWDVLAPMEAGIAGVWVNPADLPADGAEAGYRIVRTIAELVDGVSPT
jgi:putative hydrolase of the HAD superfamily